MQKDLSKLRKNYDKGSLLDHEIPDSPYNLYEDWFTQAQLHKDIDEVNAVSLSTFGLDGFPKARIVLLKEIKQGNFIFYSNYNSEKAIAMDKHSKVSLHFFWPALEKQIIIKGYVSKVSIKKSLDYFQSRPRGSQLGAWASEQSKEINSREELEDRLTFFKNKFEGKDIPLPNHWGGYAVNPISFEFWQGRPNRLHDRFVYELFEGKWINKRLAP